MNSHPIIFSAPMLAAILDGRKTQTRRIVTCRYKVHGHFWDEAWVDPGGTIFGPGPYLKLPYHHVEDGADDRQAERVRCPYGYPEDGATLWVKENWTANGQKRSSRFMPRVLCRLEIEIIKVRCERLGAPTDEDIRAEGFSGFAARANFAALWDRLNGARGFAYLSNPWVWVIEFKPKPPIQGAQGAPDNA